MQVWGARHALGEASQQKGMSVHIFKAILSGGVWLELFVQVVVSLPPLKKIGSVFQFPVHGADRRRVHSEWRRCVGRRLRSGGRRCGEEAERWSRAENIRNWRKVRNRAFSWLPHSCNFHTTA